MVLRKYSRNGELLGSFLPRSTFPAGLEPGGAFGLVSIVAAGNRIAVVANSGDRGTLRELIELDGSGEVRGRMRLDQELMRFFALTTDGQVYGWCRETGAGSELTLFDPATNTSKKVDTLARGYILLGADGENLVYRTMTKDGQLRAVWFHPPAANR
jgi:hypothetical protein